MIFNILQYFSEKYRIKTALYRKKAILLHSEKYKYRIIAFREAT